MKVILAYLALVILSISLFIFFSKQVEDTSASSEKKPITAPLVMEPIILKAKYKGIGTYCSSRGTGKEQMRVRLFCEFLTVQSVEKGEMKYTDVLLKGTFSPEDKKNLVKGKTYTFKFTPSQASIKELTRVRLYKSNDIMINAREFELLEDEKKPASE